VCVCMCARVCVYVLESTRTHATTQQNRAYESAIPLLSTVVHNTMCTVNGKCASVYYDIIDVSVVAINTGTRQKLFHSETTDDDDAGEEQTRRKH
jgi:hypothetical protein